MKLGNFDGRIGKGIISFVLAGTIAACIVSAPKLLNASSSANSDISRGFYTDEDVKKNRAVIMKGISDGNAKEAKTYGKKKSGN